jgi:TolB-like protein/Tfp pilus assembly protein PilF
MAPVGSFRLKLLGGFEARRVDGSTIKISAKKSRALLAYLALTGGRTHQRGKLADLLWSDRGDKQARDSLRQALAELRDALADVHPAALGTDHDLVSLAPAAVDIDALCFAELAGRDSAEELRHAAALYDGDLLDGLDVRDAAFDDWLSRERQRYRELMVEALKKLLPHETGTTAMGVAQRVLTLDPLEEAGHRALMRLYAEVGDIAAALRQYDTCRATLKRELDIAPSPETEVLHRQIRGQSTMRPGGDRAAVSATDTPQPSTASTSKPSVAVLPFRNLSGDPEQQYFSDGITEDIITELSRFHSLFVIARHSSFQFRDKTMDVKETGRELGVEYVVEGSVRRSAGRVRITARLIETESGGQLWSEHYDQDMTEIFAIQDQVVQAIVAALPGRIWEAGARSARRKRPENLAAYDYLLRGIELFLTFDKADTQAARAMLEKAIVLDPTIASAYGVLAALQLRDWWSHRSVQALDRAFLLAKKAVTTDENDGFCHGMLGYVCLERRRFDDATFHIERSLALNPNDPDAAVCMGALSAYLGRAEEGIAWIEKAFRLDPYAPQWYNSAYGMILFAGRLYADAIAAFNRILAPRDGAWEFLYLIASHGHLARYEEAQALAGKCAALPPGVSLLEFAAREPFKNQADLEHLLDGLRKAGPPQ